MQRSHNSQKFIKNLKINILLFLVSTLFASNSIAQFIQDIDNDEQALTKFAYLALQTKHKPLSIADRVSFNLQMLNAVNYKFETNFSATTPWLRIALDKPRALTNTYMVKTMPVVMAATYRRQNPYFACKIPKIGTIQVGTTQVGATPIDTMPIAGIHNTKYQLQQVTAVDKNFNYPFGLINYQLLCEADTQAKQIAFLFSGFNNDYFDGNSVAELQPRFYNNLTKAFDSHDNPIELDMVTIGNLKIARVILPVDSRIEHNNIFGLAVAKPKLVIATSSINKNLAAQDEVIKHIVTIDNLTQNNLRNLDAKITLNSIVDLQSNSAKLYDASGNSFAAKLAVTGNEIIINSIDINAVGSSKTLIVMFDTKANTDFKSIDLAVDVIVTSLNTKINTFENSILAIDKSQKLQDGSIGGVIFIDTNKNASFDSFEVGVEGVRVSTLHSEWVKTNNKGVFLINYTNINKPNINKLNINKLNINKPNINKPETKDFMPLRIDANTVPVNVTIAGKGNLDTSSKQKTMSSLASSYLSKVRQNFAIVMTPLNKPERKFSKASKNKLSLDMFLNNIYMVTENYKATTDDKSKKIEGNAKNLQEELREVREKYQNIMNTE